MAKLPIFNTRMLQLIAEMMAEKGITRIKAYEAIGSSPNNHSNYQKGLNKFTIEQIMQAAKLNNVSIDWICGHTKSREPIKAIGPIERIERAIKELKAKN